MSDIICTVTREFSQALDRVSEGVDINRVAVFRIENGGLNYYRLMIGRGHFGATDLLDEEIALDLHAKRAVGPGTWDGIAERLVAKLALVESGKDFSYSERAWKAETEGRFSPNTPLPDSVHIVTISPETRREMVTAIMDSDRVRIVIVGPRAPFQLINERTGHVLAFTARIKEGESLRIDVPARSIELRSESFAPPFPPTRALRLDLRIPTVQPVSPDYRHLEHAWFALAEGVQTLAINEIEPPDPLAEAKRVVIE